MSDSLSVTAETIDFNDSVFSNQPLSEWSTDTLEVFICSDAQSYIKYDWVKRKPLIDIADVISELKRRKPIEPAWTDQQIINYLKTGQEPPKTLSGVWVTDITRLNRSPRQWSDAEILAWARNEIALETKNISVTIAHLKEEIKRRRLRV